MAFLGRQVRVRVKVPITIGKHDENTGPCLWTHMITLPFVSNLLTSRQFFYFFVFCLILKFNHFYFIHRSPDQRWIMGYRSSCSPYSSCSRWRNSSLRPGCLRQHVSRWSHVRSHPSLATLASQGQPQPATVCRRLCHRCLGSSCSCHEQR